MKANVAFLVVLLIISASVVFAVSSIPAKTEAYAVRGPIVIADNNGFTPANGVVSGSGVAEDPYVISGWHIIVSSGAGISISDTDRYFIIADVWINGTASRTGSVTGIYLFYLWNGQVKNCLINDTDTAIDALWLYDSSVQGNDFLGTTGWAVSIQTANRVHLVDNYFFGQNGIMAISCQQSSVLLNEFLMNEMCISATDINTLTVNENIATQCGYPVSLSWSTNVQILNNVFTDCMYGMDLQHVTYAEIIGNVVERASDTGISIWGSSYTFTISDNVVNGSQTFGGIFIENCWDMEITRNVLSNNTIGFWSTGGGMTLYTGCSDMMVYNNSFVHNLPQQAQDANGPVNLWNETYPVGGNHWSNYTGLDVMQGPYQNITGSDGLGDTPFLIDADTLDFYPLMSPVPATIRPVAEFTTDPELGDITMVISFDASPSNHPVPSKNLTGYRWDFDCDGRFDTGWSSDPFATHLYQVPGNYTVVLEVVDGDGMTDMTTHTVTILEEGIIPEFGTVLAPVLAIIALVAVAFRRRALSI